MSFYLDPNDATTFTSPALVADQIDLNQENAAAALADAIASKSAFVTAIFNTKRQTPITVAVTAGTLSWDASDAAVGALTMAATNASFSGVGFASAFNDFVGPEGGAVVGTLNWGLANVSAPTLPVADNFPPQFAPVVAAFNAWWLANINFGGSAVAPPIPMGALSPTFGSLVTELSIWALTILQPNINPTPVPNVGGLASGGSPAGFSWASIGAAPVDMTPTDIAAIFSAIYARYISLQTTAATYNAALAAMTTVADVAAYDVTSAWAY